MIDTLTCNATVQSGCSNVPTVNAGSEPTGVAVDDTTDTVYVSNDAGSSVPDFASVFAGMQLPGVSIVPSGSLTQSGDETYDVTVSEDLTASGSPLVSGGGVPPTPTGKVTVCGAPYDSNTSSGFSCSSPYVVNTCSFALMGGSGNCPLGGETAAGSPYEIAADYQPPAGDTNYWPTDTTVTVDGGQASSTTGDAPPVGTNGVTVNASGPVGNTNDVTETSYPADPVGALPGGVAFFDVTATQQSPAFKSIEIEYCGTPQGPIEWYDAGTVDWNVLDTTTSGSCEKFTATRSSDPSISELTGTVFAVVPVQITTTSLPNGSVYSSSNKVAYSATLSAIGGEPPYKWSLASGSSPLPPGLRLSSKGVISGKATTLGKYSFTVQAAGKKTKVVDKATKTLWITIN